MTSATTEPPTLRSIPPIAAPASHRRSYSCYNCNYSFHIIPIPATSESSPSSFRCPRCHHRHLIPHHTISPSPPPSPSRHSPPRPTLPSRNSDYAAGSGVSIYPTSDESDSDDEYDSDNSLLSFTSPNVLSTPALKSFVASLPIKVLAPNSTPTLQSCSICMEDFEINSDAPVTVNELPCEHYFHRDCIVEWLQRSNTCPLCRYKLPIDSAPDTGPEEENAGDMDQWEVESEAILVVDLAGTRDPLMRLTGERGASGGERGASGEQSLPSDADLGSDGQVLGTNGGETSGLEFDAMRDEDGDTLMVDA